MDQRKTENNKSKEVNRESSRRASVEGSRARAKLKDDPGDSHPNRAEDTKSNKVLDLSSQVPAVSESEEAARCHLCPPRQDIPQSPKAVPPSDCVRQPAHPQTDWLLLKLANDAQLLRAPLQPSDETAKRGRLKVNREIEAHLRRKAGEI